MDIVIKKAKMLLATFIIACFFSSCQYTELDDILRPKEAGELLRVSTYVQREDLPDGYFEYENDKTSYQGHWLTRNGEKIHASKVFEEQYLEVGKTRICAPMCYIGRQNLLIRIEFDGYVEIEPDPVDDDRIRLAHSVNNPDSISFLGMSVENVFKARSPFNLGICPIGRFDAATAIVSENTLADCEYFINIRAYDINERPKASARLRIKSIKDPDPNYKATRDEFSIYGKGEETTRFLEIELVSVEYGDKIG